MILRPTAVVCGHLAAAVVGIVNLGICIPNAVWSSVRCIWLSLKCRIYLLARICCWALRRHWSARPAVRLEYCEPNIVRCADGEVLGVVT